MTATAKQLISTAAEDVENGLYCRALDTLRCVPRRSVSEDLAAYQILLAEAMLSTGDLQGAKSISSNALRNPLTSASLRARHLGVLGSVLFAEGRLQNCLDTLLKAVAIADSSGDVAVAAQVQLTLLRHLSDVVSPTAASSHLASAQRRVWGSSKTRLVADLQRCRGQLAAKTGIIDEAWRHFEQATEILSRHPNVALEAAVHVDSSALACVTGDLSTGMRSALKARELAERSGHALAMKGALGNLGIICLYQGDFAEAGRFLQLGLSQPPNDHTDRVLKDTYAQLLLEERRLVECEAVLEELSSGARYSGQFRRSWYEVAFSVTRTRFFLTQERWLQAHEEATRAQEWAEKGRHGGFSSEIRVLKADALIMLDRQAEAAELIAEVALLTPDLTPATMAEIERVKGRLLARTGHPAEALEHLDRALRILDVVPHALLKLDLQRDRERLLADLPHPPAAAGATAAAAPLALQGAVRLLDSAGNPALLGREIVALAAAVPWIRACACLETHAGGVDVGACHGWTAEAARSAASTPRLTQLSLGSWRGRTLSVVIEPQDDPQARYGVAALRTLVEAAVTLERGRQEEKRRSALWSFDPPDGSAAGIFLSNATLEILSIAQKVAPTDLPVLITGETGTGKELLARILHQHSGRERKPFLPFNCTAMPRELVESQLFGHRRGAFTGAQESFQGVIRAAAGGTIFLDEIGELGPEVQPKLLRFLETGEIHPLGEPKPIAVDVRIVAATNVDLDGLVASGRFREDLYYRLNVVRLTIPPLRERREEIPPLLHHFIAKSCGEVGKAPLRIADEALEYLVLFSWPGNVRQLANEIRRLVALAESGTRIEPAHLSPEIRASRRTLPAGPAGTADEVTVRIDQPLAAAVEQIERAMLQRALRQAGGNLEAAAQALGISRKGLYLKRHRLGLGPLAPAPERTEGARLPAEE